jgi:hypothetical protein
VIVFVDGPIIPSAEELSKHSYPMLDVMGAPDTPEATPRGWWHLPEPGEVIAYRGLEKSVELLRGVVSKQQFSVSTLPVRVQIW